MIVDFNNTKDKLDEVGCGFCLAKWTQVTMHLHNGMTHSCHHPAPHKISLEELKQNPTALHNTRFKKKKRKEMLEGERPDECNYCWNVEDNSNSFSDRVFKSSEPWSEPYFEEIKNLKWDDDYNPKYVEVSFSNICNFKCAYCGPQFSSKWVEEIREHGEYNVSWGYNSLKQMEGEGTIPIPHYKENPYVDAFWKWWPDLYNSLDTFRITGGEPLMSKDTWKVLDYIIDNENPNTNLKLSINSNLGVPDDMIDKLIEKLTIIIDENRVKELIIFTSCDAYGKDSEYVRFGLNFDKLITNVEKILEQLPKVTVVIMSTFNIFSVFSYESLLKKVYDLKVKFFNKERYWNSAVILDTSYLRYPNFLSFRILKDYITEEYFNRMEKYMKFHSTYRSLNSYAQQDVSDVGFSLKEIEKISRIRDIFVMDSLSDTLDFRNECNDFVSFIIEYDKRRDVSWESYYPNLVNFVEKIKNENKI
jgi:MoaA/NifB/PqqE/SkfB family radical SAM enzyme